MNTLSTRAHELLKALFSEQSAINIPVAYAAEVLEIRNALNALPSANNGQP